GISQIPVGAGGARIVSDGMEEGLDGAIQVALFLEGDTDPLQEPAVAWPQGPAQRSVVAGRVAVVPQCVSEVVLGYQGLRLQRQSVTPSGNGTVVVSRPLQSGPEGDVGQGAPGPQRRADREEADRVRWMAVLPPDLSRQLVVEPEIVGVALLG